MEILDNLLEYIKSSIKHVESSDNSVKHMETQIIWCGILKQVQEITCVNISLFSKA